MKKYRYMRIMYLSVNSILSCCPKGSLFSSPASCASSVTRSLVKKYSSRVSGRAMIERTDIRRIHLDLSAPMAGMMTLGKTSATRMPDIMIVVIWLKTDRPPLAVLSLVESGTMRLWLMLKMV